MDVPCPEFISVVSFDDFLWTAYFKPRLTAISQPSHEMGRRAMQMLLSVLDADRDSKEPPPEIVVLEPELIIRQSTAPPRHASPSREPPPNCSAVKSSPGNPVPRRALNFLTPST